ncbi:sigma-70 family RNA polymerase sigma factor [Achromobacter spanius]|uniref:sigma-70 family RNA polymerase sigma factor n=1 Tax=Achromobacter spanius TaxID=217203 RepID=UPI000F8F8A76|nr:sigma-70 family RNA polymerase sigma factor [Achromobacter spanius]AZS79597.1 sigma-70 family RNA polymerase sigma factor [Achromobacter spanius]
MSNTASIRDELAALYQVHRRKLLHTATRILGSRDLADDVVQDTYLKLLEGPSPKDVREPVAYLFQTVRHLSIDYHRRRALESRLFAGQEDGQYAVSESVAEDAAVSHQALALAAQALATMSARTRRAFELHRFEGCTQRDAARELGVSTTLVNFMIRDADVALNSCREYLLPG